jgi:TPR repeat protein
MKRALYILLISGAPLWADFKSGLAAYDRGDFPMALQEWLPMAQRGDANAEFNVGLLYATGKGVKRDLGQAADWYRKAAEQGVGAAEFNLGVMYANGDAVPRDVHQAVKWLQKASDAGIPMGREELANLYGSKGIENHEKSVENYTQAATQGSPTAQFDLALLYDLGQSVPRNYEEAMKWYRKAADQGYAPAMTNVGILYYNQEGVKRDLVQAYAWFVRAKLAGDPRAGDLLQMTMDKLKGEQIRQGETLAADWHPQKPSAKAQMDMASLDAKLFKQPGPAASIGQTMGPAANQSSGEASRQSAPMTTVTGVERVVAIGDGDGQAVPFLRTLQSASLVDSDGQWIGGKTHLVVTADHVEGPFADLLNRLQAQAESAQGGVHVLVGPEGAVRINDTQFLHDASFGSESDLLATLRDHGVWRVVVGHGDGSFGIMPRYQGRLIVNDDPLRDGCLVIEYGKPFALYRGRGLALPDDTSADLERYRRQVSEAALH